MIKTIMKYVGFGACFGAGYLSVTMAAMPLIQRVSMRMTAKILKDL